MTLHANSPNSDQNYSAGSLTRVYIPISAGLHNDVMDGILTHADQDGTLKADSVDVTAVIKDNVVSNAKLSEFKPNEVVSDFIASGGVVAQSAGLVGTFSNIVYYISGVRYTATSVANKTYTASKDTYVDINSSGTPTYTEVANNAASPALTAGYIRVAKVVTNGSAITSVVQWGSDSLGNLIYNTDPHKQGQWIAFTPTWTNLTVGSAVQSFRYSVIGKTVHLRGFITLGAGSSVAASPTFTLPILAKDVGKGTASGNAQIGYVYYEDNGTANNQGPVSIASTSTATPLVYAASGTYVAASGISSTVPFTFVSGDEMRIFCTYEAA